MSWDGKYVVTEQKNIDGFLKHLGLPDEEIKRIKALKIATEIRKNGNEFTITQSSGDNTAVLKFRLGESSELSTIEGMKLKGIIALKGQNVLSGKFEGGIEENAELDKNGNIVDTFSKDGVSYVRVHTRQ